MNKLALVDVSNLYYTINKKYHKRLDYSKLLSKVKCNNLKAYTSEMNGKGNVFINILKNLGFSVITKPVKKYIENNKVNEKANLDIELVIDAVRNRELIDELILCSSDGDMVPMVKYLQEKNVKVKVLGCAINSDLRSVADSWEEIDETLLEDCDELQRSTKAA